MSLFVQVHRKRQPTSRRSLEAWSHGHPLLCSEIQVVNGIISSPASRPGDDHIRLTAACGQELLRRYLSMEGWTNAHQRTTHAPLFQGTDRQPCLAGGIDLTALRWFTFVDGAPHPVPIGESYYSDLLVAARPLWFERLLRPPARLLSASQVRVSSAREAVGTKRRRKAHKEAKTRNGEGGRVFGNHTRRERWFPEAACESHLTSWTDVLGWMICPTTAVLPTPSVGSL